MLIGSESRQQEAIFSLSSYVGNKGEQLTPIKAIGNITLGSGGLRSMADYLEQKQHCH